MPVSTKPGPLLKSECSIEKIIGNGENVYEKNLEDRIIRGHGCHASFAGLSSPEEGYEYYPNASLQYVTMDDYNHVIPSALVNSEPPDIFTTTSWMIGDEAYQEMFDNCEVLSDPSLGIDYSCIRDSLIRTTDAGDVLMLPIFTRM